MRPGTLLLPFTLLLAACGGSSSETPWPAEPVTPAPGPADEASPAEPDGAGASPEGADEGAADRTDAGR
ncbi:hypothetical protein SOCE26_101370 [Sorangium cellulosum]|uniref:Secreted protein n=1 Tax=Sorangium cellulosum TaxID=56 RepID=A0A2L0FAH2_SORCE|nr:hypothetical protein [Sorangium cellulosum]AUX48598.1 hypothetical protein SOCE26_101370 [Sorangium cellulosum]